MSIGKNIADFRKAKGLTQAELGDLIGVSNQAVSKWESEMTMPDVMLLPKIAEIFDVTINQLYEGLDEETIKEQSDIEDRSIAAEKKRILLVSVEGGDKKVKTRLPLEAVRFFLKGNEVLDLGEEGNLALGIIDKVFNSTNTLVDVDTNDKKVKITIENYED